MEEGGDQAGHQTGAQDRHIQPVGAVASCHEPLDLGGQLCHKLSKHRENSLRRKFLFSIILQNSRISTAKTHCLLNVSKLPGCPGGQFVTAAWCCFHISARFDAASVQIPVCRAARAGSRFVPKHCTESKSFSRYDNTCFESGCNVGYSHIYQSRIARGGIPTNSNLYTARQSDQKINLSPGQFFIAEN